MMEDTMFWSLAAKQQGHIRPCSSMLPEDATRGVEAVTG
jgi:hypothetical protein